MESAQEVADLETVQFVAGGSQRGHIILLRSQEDGRLFYPVQVALGRQLDTHLLGPAVDVLQSLEQDISQPSGQSDRLKKGPTQVETDTNRCSYSNQAVEEGRVDGVEHVAADLDGQGSVEAGSPRRPEGGI